MFNPLLLLQFDLKMENPFFLILSLYQQETLVELSHILMVAQLGIVHPPVPLFVNVRAGQAGLIPQWYY